MFDVWFDQQNFNLFHPNYEFIMNLLALEKESIFKRLPESGAALLIVEFSSSDKSLSKCPSQYRIAPGRDYSFPFLDLDLTLFETETKISLLNNKLFQLLYYRS